MIICHGGAITVLAEIEGVITLSELFSYGIELIATHVLLDLSCENHSFEARECILGGNTVGTAPSRQMVTERLRVMNPDDAVAFGVSVTPLFESVPASD